MPGCAFIQCTNHSRTKSKSVGITFHAFPQDGLCKHEWVEVVRSQRREPDWTPTEHSRICSDHFRLGDIYKTGKGLMRIKKEAIPYFQDKLTRDAFAGPSSPNSLDNEDISDLKPIFDSPRISFLKGRIRKLLNSKKKLIRDNKNLKVRNKRLAAKCKSLEDLVLRLEALVKSDGNQQELPSPNQEQQ